MEEEIYDEKSSGQEVFDLIYNTINELFSNLFSSIDNNLYSLLDDIVFLDSKTVITSSIENIFFSDKFNLLILANILVGCVITYKVISIVISIYTNKEASSPFLYIVKSVIIIIIMNNCLFICEQIIEINSYVTTYLIELGEHLFKKTISFLTFANEINTYISSSNTFDLFSLDGVIKSMVTLGSITLLVSYIIRFILIKLLILCSPFVFLCLLQENLKPYFNNWLKYFISLLLTQNIVCIVLYIPYILEFNNDTYSKFLIICTITILYKLNSYIKEFMGGFSTDSNIGFGSSILRTMQRK